MTRRDFEGCDHHILSVPLWAPALPRYLSILFLYRALNLFDVSVRTFVAPVVNAYQGVLVVPLIYGVLLVAKFTMRCMYSTVDGALDGLHAFTNLYVMR